MQVESSVEYVWKPFEKSVCPKLNTVQELDSVFGYSLEAIVALLRRREIKIHSIPAAMSSVVGFETRFHKIGICNITYEPLHPGYTKGSHLLNVCEFLQFLKKPFGVPTYNFSEFKDKFQSRFEKEILPDWYMSTSPYKHNIYFEFLREILFNIRCILHDEKNFTYTANVRVNSNVYSCTYFTAAGCVVNVLNTEGSLRPCELPIKFRDIDYIYALHLLRSGGDSFSFDRLTHYSNYVNQCDADFISDINVDSTAKLNAIRDALSNGLGILAAVKKNPDLFGKYSIPQLQFI